MLLRRLRNCSGQTAPEYLGALLTISVIVAAVVLTPVGDTIKQQADRIICEIAGQECGVPATIDPECLLSSDTRESDFSVNIVAVKIGEGETLIKEVFADGRTVFTLVDNAEVAAELLAGAKAHVGKIGFNASASLSAGGKLEGGRVFEFTDPKQAAAFEKLVSNAGTFSDFLHQAFEDGGGGILPGILGWDPFGLRDKLADTIFGDDPDNLPKPTSTYISAQAFLSGDANVSAGIPGLDGELVAAAEAAGGVKVVTSGKDAGTATLDIELSADAAADLGLYSLGPGIGGKAKFTVELELAKRSDGSYGPKSLKVDGTAEYDGTPLQASQLANESNLGALKKAIKEASATSVNGSGQQVEFAAELDLQDPDNLRAALGLLNQNGVDPQGVADLVSRFDTDGKLTFQTYDTTASDDSAEIKGGLGVNAGVGGGQTEDTQNLTDAWVRDPGGDWVPRQCGQS